MSDNDNLSAAADGTGTATPSDSVSANDLAALDFEEQDRPANPEPEQAASATDDEPVEGEDAQETEAEGEQPEAEDDEAEAPAASDKATVRLANGETITVEEARNGYMRQADYSVKTSQLAEQRRALEANATNIQRASENLAEFLQANLPPEPDPSLLYTDPQAHYRQKALHDAALGQVQQILSMGAGPKETVAKMTAEQQREVLASENAKLAERFPETTRPESRQKFFDGAFNTARQLGYSDAEFANVTDHRLFALAHYAKLGMEAQKAKAIAARKVENKPPVVAPVRQNIKGSADARAYQAAKNRFAQTGALEDAIALLPD